MAYEHRLIDDMMAAPKRDSGFVWTCKNNDGEVQPDAVAQRCGSLGLMTLVLPASDDDTLEAGRVHGAVTRHYQWQRQAKETSTNLTASLFTWGRRRRDGSKVNDAPQPVELAKDLAMRIGPEPSSFTAQQGLGTLGETLLGRPVRA